MWWGLWNVDRWFHVGCIPDVNVSLDLQRLAVDLPADLSRTFSPIPQSLSAIYYRRLLETVWKFCWETTIDSIDHGGRGRKESSWHKIYCNNPHVTGGAVWSPFGNPRRLWKTAKFQKQETVCEFMWIYRTVISGIRGTASLEQLKVVPRVISQLFTESPSKKSQQNAMGIEI